MRAGYVEISAPVGAIAANKSNDVKQVQRLLNMHTEGFVGVRKFSIDGMFSASLVDAIKDFQTLVQSRMSPMGE
ncbi:peptidoglycan-binding domain-containing protein [Paracidovorax sp. MALMAid1276]|uniref:peptidoglycan-binding domain-containing protein n=1 Tax=Paracidovorax sp. MALMAid1276 TaxID=3411631 RepID=UPI003B9C7A21